MNTQAAPSRNRQLARSVLFFLVASGVAAKSKVVDATSEALAAGTTSFHRTHAQKNREVLQLQGCCPTVDEDARLAGRILTVNVTLVGPSMVMGPDSEGVYKEVVQSTVEDAFSTLCVSAQFQVVQVDIRNQVFASSNRARRTTESSGSVVLVETDIDIALHNPPPDYDTRTLARRALSDTGAALRRELLQSVGVPLPEADVGRALDGYDPDSCDYNLFLDNLKASEDEYFAEVNATVADVAEEQFYNPAVPQPRKATNSGVKSSSLGSSVLISIFVAGAAIAGMAT